MTVMAKKVLTTENCVITSDEKGQLSLVGKAKEALTTLSKNKISVTILLEKNKKEDVEKFLKENNVPFASLAESSTSLADLMKGMDAVIVPDSKFITLNGDWEWTLNGIVRKLYGSDKTPQQKSEQQKMDDEFNDYKRWTAEANKRKSQTSVG